ncbi:defensin-C-like [Toxorhynchites rutilus septentrionalis]|uniref:defensin-C-like n=1 Tax=Toxorhynchites rutilus septentrionalis TaxID=329112 RepID=UPI00247940A0|nr:defensin-C-like [Toxorhynchites rutilus septentrionalis]
MQSTTILCFALVCLATVCSTGYALPQDGVLTEETKEYLRSALDPVAEADHDVGSVQEHRRLRRPTCADLDDFQSICVENLTCIRRHRLDCRGIPFCTCRPKPFVPFEV